MNNPGIFICLDHGHMSVNLTLILIGQMSEDVLTVLIEFAVGFFERCGIGADDTVFVGINETRTKKKFPERIHIYLAGYIDMRIGSLADGIEKSFLII